MSERSIDGNDKKRFKKSDEEDENGNGKSTGNGKSSGNGQSDRAGTLHKQSQNEGTSQEKKTGRGRGRGGTSSESSASGSGSKKDKTSDGASTSVAGQSAVPTEDRRDGRALLSRYSEPRTRPDSYAYKTTPIDKDKRYVANYFKIKCSQDFNFIQYRVDIEPDTDHKFVRRALVANCQSHLRGYVFDGGNIVFVTRPLRENPLRIATRMQNEDRDYQVTFKKTDMVVKMTDGMAIHVLNVILRKAMGGLNLKEIQRHLYDMEARIRLPELRLELLPGYITSIRSHEDDILVCTEITHKVLRQDNLLEILIQLTNRGGDYQDQFRREVIGTVVLTPYNNRTYRIDDIKFEWNPRRTFDMKGQQVSFADYYRNKYNITLRDMNQPLLISNPKPRDIRGGATGPSVLIPELCVATGLTDAMRNNFNMMRTMGEHTRLNPLNRAKRLLEFSRRMNQSNVSQEVLESFGLEMERNLVQLQGHVINQEKIVFGNNRQVQNDHTADWTNAIRSNIMYRSVPLTRWGIIYPNRMERDVEEFMKILREVARGQQYEMAEPRVIKLPDDRNNSYVQKLTEFCSKDPKFVMVFLPNNSSDRYKAVKSITYVQHAIPSQVCCLKTIQPKKGNWAGVKSIATKILLQMNSKLGGAPWMIAMPMKGVMIIGFDVTHDTASKSSAYGAFVASMDLRESVKYYSAVAKHHNGQEIAGNIATHMQQALITFKQEHQCLPDRILFYRDGVGDGQIEQVLTYELEKIHQVIKANYKQDEPKFAFVIVSKRINTRIFEEKKGNHYENPVSGTVIDNTITLPNRYEFFLISQSIRQGTVSPTNYNVIYDTFGLSPERLQQLTYKMTHLYYNWSGTTRVPAVVQYAHKLSMLIGILQTLPNNSRQLNERLYFL